jgi:Putative transmembrane protein (Alph_Pro_TM)
MNKINGVRIGLVFILACLLTNLAVPTAFAVSRDLRLTPSEIHIRETFQGAPMSITATVPPQSLSIIEIKGESHKLELLRKGRRGGLWMNVGEVNVQAAPSMYLMLTNESGAILKKDLGANFGYAALKNIIRFSGKLPKTGTDVLFEQFLQLKESEGLYGIFPGAIKVNETNSEGVKIEGNINLPSNIAPGTYQVVLSVVKDEKLLEQEITEFTVEMKGLPKLLSSLAFEHALLYGSLAVIIAIVSGFLMGFVFGGKGAH